MKNACYWSPRKSRLCSKIDLLSVSEEAEFLDIWSFLLTKCICEYVVDGIRRRRRRQRRKRRRRRKRKRKRKRKRRRRRTTTKD